MKRMLRLPTSIVTALACGVAAAAPAVGGEPLARCAPMAPRLAARGGGSAVSLVRAGARSLLLCRYHGLNPAGTAHRLQSSRLISARPEIAAIAAGLNALPALPQPVNCPLDDGREIVATFAYTTGGDTVVQIELTGCRAVTGGSPPVRTASGQHGQHVLAQLAALVR